MSRGTQIVSVGGDGLLKVWTIKTDECIVTLDAHEDKAWALAVHRDGDLLATGTRATPTVGVLLPLLLR